MLSHIPALYMNGGQWPTLMMHHVRVATCSPSVFHSFDLLIFQSFPFAVTSAEFVKDAQAIECAGVIRDGGSFIIMSGKMKNLETDCVAAFTADYMDYTAASCPGCTVTEDGEVTFLEPPVALGCNQDEINAANPCSTTSSTTTVDVESSNESSSTSTSTESTVNESKCTVNGVVSPCDEVTDDTNGATAGNKIVSVGAITIVGVCFLNLIN